MPPLQREGKMEPLKFCQVFCLYPDVVQISASYSWNVGFLIKPNLGEFSSTVLTTAFYVFVGRSTQFGQVLIMVGKKRPSA